MTPSRFWTASSAAAEPEPSRLRQGLPLVLRAADEWATVLHQAGHHVIRTIGVGLPLPLIRACNLAGVAVQPAPTAARQRSEDALVESVARAEPRPLLIRTDDPQGYAVFSIIREHMRVGSLPQRPLFGLDLPGGHGQAVSAYRVCQLHKFVRWAQTVGGRSGDDRAFDEALARERAREDLLDRLDVHRSGKHPSLSARDWLSALVAASVLPIELHIQALELLCRHTAEGATLGGPRIFVAGLYPDAMETVEGFDRMGMVVVGDDLGWLGPERPAPDSDRWSLVQRGPVRVKAIDPIERAVSTVQQAQRVGAARVVHLARTGDDRELWFRRWLAKECQRVGLDFAAHDVPTAPVEAAAVLRTAAPLAGAPGSGQTVPPPATEPAAESAPAATSSGATDGRSRKSLSVVAEFSAYQREWFQSIRRRAAEGEPFAVVNADAPQELLRAFDLPFVVNQWWGSIVAAKQQSRRYLQLLSERSYPVDAEPYSAQGLAALFDRDRQHAPWGGLPTPRLLLAVNGTPATAGIFSSWATESGAELLLFDRTAETRVELPVEWWEQLPTHWETWLPADRLDLLQAQFGQAIERIQTVTGRRFDEALFREVMDLVNRQEEFYRQTRDLIAAAARAPVSVVDTMPAIMVPQWHRGTPWGVNAARSLFEEVRLRVERGQGVCADERLRLMWVGRGLWSRMAFYQQWEESHGAVFVWSMYQGLAADGYLRYVTPRQSALRALASRFVTMGDELRMPTWAGAWHVKEARLHRVDAAVAVDDADPLVLQALERDGIPVLRLNLSNFGVLDVALARAGIEVREFLDRIQAGKGDR